MIVQTYTRRARLILWHGHYRLQRWHVTPDGKIGWHGEPLPVVLTPDGSRVI
jgi:hypothetical protein